MVTPEGSQADSSIVVPIRRSPIQGAPAYNMTVNAGRITLWKRSDKGDGWQEVATVPTALTRYWGSDGLTYVLPREGADPYHAPADDLSEGRTWRRIGVTVPRLHREAAEFAVRQVAEDAGLPVPTSPSIERGFPPLAPPTGPVADADPELGRQTWGWMAGRLAPLGRLTVGAALSAPWLEARGGTSALWTLVGEGAAGKSALLHTCASIYGPTARWWHTFDTTARGLTALAQTHSYYPLMLDEAQTITSSPAAALTPIIMGAQRTRSTRSGAIAADMGRWKSLVFLTSNRALSDDLKHEMWDRRLIEVDAEMLWQERPREPTEQNQWWADIYSAMTVMQGFPWPTITAQSTPGTETAFAWMKAATQSVVMPGAGNLGMVTQLAVAGCQWLAEWTGNPAWSDGVHSAAIALCAEREELKTDPARDASRSLIEHRATQPHMWGTDGRETVAYAGGYDGACKIEHPDHTCEWTAIVSGAWSQVCPSIPAPRLRGTAFRNALAPGDGKNLTRTWRVPSAFANNPGRIRAYVVCWRGIETLAWPETEAPPLPPPDTEEPGPTGGPPATPPPGPTSPPQQPSGSSSASVPQFAHVNEPDPALLAEHLADIGSILDAASGEGITDLSVPRSWTPDLIKDAGWGITRERKGGQEGQTDEWRGQGGARICRLIDGRKITVRIDRDPKELCDTLHDFYHLSGREIGSSVSSFSIRLLREIVQNGGSKTEPRLLLPRSVVSQFPEPGHIAHPAAWGKPNKDEDQAYDRVRSHLPAITQAKLAPLLRGDEYAHYAGSDIPEVSGSYSGMWRITVPEWDSRLPSPVAAHDPGSDLWVSTELIRLYHERGVVPKVSEAWLAPTRTINALHTWSNQVKLWLSEGDARPAGRIPKQMYQAFAGRLSAPWAAGQRNSAYRPDWGWAIRDNAWCSTVRHTYEIAERTGIYPTAVRTDAIYYPADVDVPVCQPGPGEKRTRGAIPLGDGLGQFRLEGQPT